MGYSSSVEILVYAEPETFDAYMNAMKLINHRVFTDWNEWGEEVFEWHDGERMKILNFSIDDVKWYDGYEAIDAWEQDFLPKAVEAGLNWEFARIGEDPSDVVHAEGGEDIEGLLYISSNIERNF
jgi:hypothetical protein